MRLLTNWGYTLTDVNVIPDMMEDWEYSQFTGRNDDPIRVSAELSAACAAIQNYVGWHLYPSLSCSFETIIRDRRIIRTGRDMIIQLPARYVTDISSVTIGGKTYKDYHNDPSGLLTVFDVLCTERNAKVVVEYVAGLPEELMSPIKELIAHRVTHSMAVPAGVTSEASGGVSVTYNATWINNSRATALAGDNKELLTPYKVQGVF